MRVSIKCQPIGPLKILPELPDARLALMEGLNGIGKTLAIRLLELCTGGRPYSMESAAWRSLCMGLGEFQVTIGDLNGTREIRWRADTRDWLDLSADIATLPFREITVDGKASSLQSIQAILAVHRLSGDEGIIETLAQEADAAGEIVGRWRRRYADQKAGPLARLEAIAYEGIRLLGDWSLETYRSLAATSEDARVTAAAALEVVENAQRRRDKIGLAHELSIRLSELRRRSPDLVSRLERADQELADLEGKRERLQRDIAELAGRVAGSKPIQRELTNAMKTLERNRDRLARQTSKVSKAASELNVAPTQYAVREVIGSLRNELEGLKAEQTALDAAPSMRALLDGLGLPLAQAETGGLGDQIALDDPVTEVQLTVSQTRTGMATRRAYLEGKPPPPQAREVAQRVDRARQSLDRAEVLLGLLEEANRYKRLVATNEDRVQRAVAAFKPTITTELRQLEKQRVTSDERLLELVAERERLKQQLGVGEGANEKVLSSQLVTVLGDLGIGEEDLDATLEESQSGLQTSQITLIEADASAADFRRHLVRAEAEIRKAASALRSHRELDWVRQAIAESKRPIGPGLQDQLQLVDDARDRASAVGDRLGELRAQLAAVELALRGVARHLRGQDPETSRYLSELQGWLGIHFSSWFNLPRVRKELLPTAEGDIKVDLGTSEVRWTEHGITRSRPLDAFSSGEQAFAYTRARLARLDEAKEQPANRLIVLDEFGAFIAHDRLSGLLAYLSERANQYPNDQVLVVLPLSRDYSELASKASVSEAETYRRLADEIATREYAVRPLTT